MIKTPTPKSRASDSRFKKIPSHASLVPRYHRSLGGVKDKVRFERPCRPLRRAPLSLGAKDRFHRFPHRPVTSSKVGDPMGDRSNFDGAVSRDESQPDLAKHRKIRKVVAHVRDLRRRHAKPPTERAKHPQLIIGALVDLLDPEIPHAAAHRR